MAGVSVTFEHLGIMRAAAGIVGDLSPTAITAQLTRSAALSERNIGRVTDAWEAADGGFWATAVVPATPAIEWLIASKQLGACSLTHIMTDAHTAVPLELSLVGVPARPGCLIRLASTSALDTAMYKARTICGGIQTMTDSQPTTEAAAALKELAPAHRDLIVAKLANLVAAVDAADKRAIAAEAGATKRTTELETANAALAQQKLMADVDIGLLGAQIQQLCNAMPKDMLQNFSVTATDTIEAFNSGNPAKMATSALRTIMCANAAMMASTANRPVESVGGAVEPSLKRARQQEQPPTFNAPTMINEAPPTQEELLARALYDSFEAPGQ